MGVEMKQKLLFICNCNLNRSPTFGKYFKKYYKNVEVKSAGVLYGYSYVVDEKLLEWADRIFVMDLSQALYIREHFSEVYLSKIIEVVGVSDEYAPDDKKLIKLIEFWLSRVKLP